MAVWRYLGLNGASAVSNVQLIPLSDIHTSLSQCYDILSVSGVKPAINYNLSLCKTTVWLDLGENSAEFVSTVQLIPSSDVSTSFN